MRVATKLIGAFALQVGILIALLVFHVGTIRDTVTTGYELSETSSRLYVSTIEQLTRIAQLEENAGKYAVTRDDGYLQKFEQISDEFAEALVRLERVPLDARERRELERVGIAWQELRRRSAPLRTGEVAPEALPDSTQALAAPLADLHESARALGLASQAVMATRLARSERAAGRAERISWAAAGIALLLSVLIPGLIVRSISRELARLKAGTRAVARGDFDHRLPPGASREFAQVARDFNTMTRRLGELDSAQRDFVSKVSHDLKTPLASMRETANILLDEVPGPLTDPQRRLLRLHEESGERLAGMIAKLLSMSSLEAAPRMVMEVKDVTAIARAAVNAAALAGRERSVHVELNAPAPVPARCDADALRQLLDNLLENASKFSPVGGSVQVTVQRVEEPAAEVPEPKRAAGAHALNEPGILIGVRDHGPGVPAEARERIFERFFQTPQGRSIPKRGVGLGLTICREIVHLHGGIIWVDDAPGGGSIFRVLIPAGVEAPVAAPAEEAALV